MNNYPSWKECYSLMNEASKNITMSSRIMTYEEELKIKHPQIEQFTNLVKAHDLTFEMSDDSRRYRSGSQELMAIGRLKVDLPKEMTVKIWNDNVDNKIDKDYRHLFYWN